MAGDPKRMVADGYDRIAERYRAWSGEALTGQRAWAVRLLNDRQPKGGSILEIGCATGLPVARALADRFDVTGVDVSPRQIALARRNVPSATFVSADATRLAFDPNRFHGVIACYALGHVPREEHAALLANIASWLRPEGVLVASFGTGDDPGTIEDHWLGVPMFFSSHDAIEGTRLVRAAGLHLERAELVTEDEDGRPVTFLWVVGRKRS